MASYNERPFARQSLNRPFEETLEGGDSDPSGKKKRTGNAENPQKEAQRDEYKMLRNKKTVGKHQKGAERTWSVDGN